MPPRPDRSAWPLPLGFHVMTSAMTWNGAVAGLPGFLAGVHINHQSLNEEGKRLRAALKKSGPGLLPAVSDAAIDRVRAMLDGVRQYQAHPFARQMTEPPTFHREGSLRLLDYGPGCRDEDAPALVAVPSLINPAHILDLGPGRSLMRHLATTAVRPLLVDWGAPEGAETSFDPGDYVTRRLEPAIQKVAEATGRPVTLLGYCMGGNLALAAAARMPDLVGALVLLATPWDFHAESAVQSRSTAAVFAGTLAMMDGHETVPMELMQLFFASLDPTLVDRKFRRFAAIDPASPEAALFVAIEDWNNSGAPLARKVAARCLGDWYAHNLTARGEWQVAGSVIDPAAIHQPALVIAPEADRIVPPASALALADALPNATARRAAGGHVTMIVGKRAQKGLWKPLGDWLEALATPA